MKVFQEDASIRLAVGETPDMFAGFAVQRAGADALKFDSQPTPQKPVQKTAQKSGQVVAVARSAKNGAGRLRAAPQQKARVAAKRSSRGRNKVAQIDHLAAAKKLQWQLRRTRSHSPEEVKTGRLICRHLLALLSEAADTSRVRTDGQLDSEHATSRPVLDQRSA